jgi:DegV family protein with EDD domain
VDFDEDTVKFQRAPFSIMIDGEELIDDDLDTKELIKKMKNSNDCIKSACPSPDVFMNKLKEYKNSFVVAISSQLSGSYNSALVAANLMKEKVPESFVHVFDSQSAAAGQTLVALKIKQMVEEDFDREEIIESTNKYIDKLKTFFILDSLDNLAKNGRITNIKAVLGNLLHIVPIMGEDGSGTIVLKEQVRGKKKAFSRLVDMMGELNIDFENTVVGITHVNCIEKAEKLRDDILARYPFKDIKIFDAGGLSASYAYDGGIVIAF